MVLLVVVLVALLALALAVALLALAVVIGAVTVLAVGLYRVTSRKPLTDTAVAVIAVVVGVGIVVAFAAWTGGLGVALVIGALIAVAAAWAATRVTT